MNVSNGCTSVRCQVWNLNSWGVCLCHHEYCKIAHLQWLCSSPSTSSFSSLLSCSLSDLFFYDLSFSSSYFLLFHFLLFLLLHFFLLVLLLLYLPLELCNFVLFERNWRFKSTSRHSLRPHQAVRKCKED